MITWAQRSIAGKRSLNHDACVVQKVLDEVFFIGVSDGLGEGQSGTVASKLVLDASLATLHKYIHNGFLGFNNRQVKSLFDKMFLHAHLDLVEAIDSKPEYIGMGATLCAGILDGHELHIGRVGNSHCFLLSGNQLHGVTVPVQIPSPGKKTKNPDVSKPTQQTNNNVAARLIGQQMHVPVVFPAEGQSLTLHGGDVILFCSDGLTGDCSPETMNAIRKTLMRHRLSPEKAADKLIALALKNGSEDNISIVVAAVTAPQRNNVLSMLR